MAFGLGWKGARSQEKVEEFLKWNLLVQYWHWALSFLIGTDISFVRLGTEGGAATFKS